MYIYDEDMAIKARRRVSHVLAESGDTWSDFVSWRTTMFCRTYLPKAIDAFFEVEEHLNRADYEQQVSEGLASVLRKFKSSIETQQKLNEQYSNYEGTTHYKIYPENDVLHGFLSQGGLKSISKWSKAAEVFPEPPPVPEAPQLDLWGNPLPAADVVPAQGDDPN